jgi:hypothetical protein
MDRLRARSQKAPLNLSPPDPPAKQGNECAYDQAPQEPPCYGQSDETDDDDAQRGQHAGHTTADWDFADVYAGMQNIGCLWSPQHIGLLITALPSIYPVLRLGT